MNIKEVQAVFSLQYGSEPRSPGRHVSEIIRELAVSRGIWSQDDQNDLDFTLAKYHAGRGEDIVRLYPAAIYRIAAGLAWEQFYGPQIPEINFHGIGELSKGGIIGTPDGLKIKPVTGALVIPEIKFTFKSSRDDREDPQERIRKEYPWTAQIASYCALATIGPIEVDNQNLVTDGELHVFWANGNYKGSGPQLRVYDIEFSREEIVANWIVIEAKSQEMDREQ